MVNEIGDTPVKDVTKIDGISIGATHQKRHLFRLLSAFLIGVLFLLPQVVRMVALNSIRDYSPFSSRSSSPATIDETFLYGPEVNYTYRQHRLANDTDAFEHHLEPATYSLLPTEVEVFLSKLFRSVAAAQIFCYFLFPAVTAWLLMSLFLELNASLMLAALLTLVTLLASFSLRTLVIGVKDLLLYGLHSGFIDTLQASRNPNPNMTFPLFLGTLLAQAYALRRRSVVLAFLAGVLGGLLFYSYIYYAISWAATAALLTVIFLVRNRSYLRASSIALLATSCVAVLFLFWVHTAKKAGGYFYRTNRLGAVYSHLPSAHDLKLSSVFIVCLILPCIAWRYLVSRNQSSSGEQNLRFASIAPMVFGCAAAGGILGMNMQVLTGVNIQPSHHFPHMVIQPALILLYLIVFLVVTERARMGRSNLWTTVPLVILFGVAAAVQIEAALNSAQDHRVVPWERILFCWLNQNTHPGDVVATTSIELALYMPLYSQDFTLMVNGTRTSASDSEIIDRYLLAEALTGTSASTIAEELQPANARSRLRRPWTSYPAFFFEYSPYLANPGILKPAVLEEALAKYRKLNPADELKRFRVDYLFEENGQEPVKIPGIEWQKVLVTTNGSLWRLNRAQESPTRAASSVCGDAR